MPIVDRKEVAQPCKFFKNTIECIFVYSITSIPIVTTFIKLSFLGSVTEGVIAKF